MIQILPVHISGRALTAEAAFLMDAQNKREAYKATLLKRLDDEREELSAAMRDGFAVLSSHMIETEAGQGIWFVLYKADDPTVSTVTTVASTDTPTAPDAPAASLDLPTLSIDDVLIDGDYVVVDTETTDKDGSEIVQIAIIDSKGKELLATLVKPRRSISNGAIAVHGINADMVKDAPTFPEVLPRIKEILTGRYVVVYNAVFDRKALHKSAEAWEIEKTEWKDIAQWHCVMERFASIYGEWHFYHGNFKWQKLSTAAAYYGLPTGGAHDALADCIMTLGVCQAMAKEIMMRKES